MIFFIRPHGDRLEVVWHYLSRHVKILANIICRPLSLSISWTASSSSSACGSYSQQTPSTISPISKYLFLYDVAVPIRWIYLPLLKRHVRNIRGTDRFLYSWCKSVCFSSPVSQCSSSSLFWLSEATDGLFSFKYPSPETTVAFRNWSDYTALFSAYQQAKSVFHIFSRFSGLSS